VGAGVERGGRSLSTTVPDKVHKRCVGNSLPTVTYHPTTLGPAYIFFLGPDGSERTPALTRQFAATPIMLHVCALIRPKRARLKLLSCMYCYQSALTEYTKPCRIQSKVELSEQNCSWFEGARTVLGALSRNTANQPKARHEARIFSPS